VTSPPARLTRLGRLALLAWPRALRARFGAEMLLAFEEAWADSNGASRLRLLADLVRAGLRARLERVRPTPSPSDPLTPTGPRSPMHDLLQELRFALRRLRRAPAFTAAAVLTLALGIGANTAIFSVVDGVLLRPAPFADIDRLAMVWETDRASGTRREPASIPDFADFQSRNRSFSSLAAMWAVHGTLGDGDGDATQVPALSVSQQFLPMLGIAPLLGRAFLPEEDVPDGPRVVLISEALWRDRFDRDPGIVGRTMRISEDPFTIIGVMPSGADFGVLQILRAAAYSRGFADSFGATRVDLWLPLQADPARSDRGNHPILMVGRLAPPASLAAAQDEMTRIAADLERTYPQANDQRGVHLEPVADVVFGPVRPALLVLLGAVALVLVVASANVANLLLARGAGRLREVTVRAALGAGFGRITRQFLIESAVLTLAGAGLGVLLAWGGLELLLALAPPSIPRLDDVALDGRVLGVTLGISLVVAMVAGLVPTLQARKAELAPTLQSDPGRGASASRGHRRIRSALVVGELALAVMLMVGAGLLIRSFWRLQQVDPGFATAGVLKAEFLLPGSRYPQRMRDFPQWVEIRRFRDEVVARLTAQPGITGVAVAGKHPLDAGFTSSITVVGREAEARDWPEPAIRLVDDGYVATLGVPILTGRGFEPADDPARPPVILVNEEARRVFFGGRDPIGQEVNLWGARRTIVGVLGGERFRGQAEVVPPAIYIPAGQSPIGLGSILVRTTGDPNALAPVVRRIVAEVDPGVPLFGIEPLARTLSNSTAERRFTTLVLGMFAAVALLLAVVGVHGVLSYTVAQRTREIGIRMALGADRGQVRSLVLGQGVRLAAVGLGLGGLGALALSQVLRTMLFGVGRADPVTFVGVAGLLGGVALLASWLPARRASRTDPAVVLKE